MSYLKATPRTILQGIQDVSTRTPIPVPVQIPTHLPHFYLMTAQGDSLPHIAIGAGFNQMYGIESLDPLSPFANHATMGARQTMSNGNMCMVQRIIPPNARKALLRVSAELVPASIVVYQRDSDGTYLRDDTGAYIPEDDGEGGIVTRIGMRVIWHIGTDQYVGALLDGTWQLDGSGTLGSQPPDATDFKRFAAGAKVTAFRDGDAVGIDGDVLSDIIAINEAPCASVLYPIFDLEVSTHGKHGDLKGIIFNAPNSYNGQRGDSVTMEVIRAYLFRIFMIERPADSITATLIETLGGDQSVDFTFKDNVLHPVKKSPLSALRAIIPPYENLKDKSIVPIHGPFGALHVYKTNIDELLSILIGGSVSDNWPAPWPTDVDGEEIYNVDAEAFGREVPYYFSSGDARNNHLLNMFTGVDQLNVPYFAFDTTGSVNFGGVALGTNSVLYASGGSDGLIYDQYGEPDRLLNLEMFDTLVRAQLKGFGSLEAKMLDDARYPISNFWDTGFSLPTKKAMLVPLSLRKDLWVGLATQTVAEYANPNLPTPQTFGWSEANDGGTETSMGLLLSEAAAVYPESEIFGTSVCRAIIVGRTNEMLNTTYQGILPYTIDVIDKVSKYMGAGDGKWKEVFSFSTSPNNQVTLFDDANITWRTPSAYENDWTNGMIWVQYFDVRTLFYPAFQTVYKNDTSVLNSFFTMAACVELTKVCSGVIRALMGEDKLTDLQFFEKSNRLISERVEGRFDKRFIIQPETFQTPADNAYGFAWSVRAHLYANNMKTVGQLTVVVHRRSELDQAAA